MKKTFTLLLMVCFLTIAKGQFSIILVDSLSNGAQFKDNALLFTPEGYNEPQASYVVQQKTDNNSVTFPAVTLSELALPSVTGLFQSWPSFDYVFPRNMDRSSGDTLKVEFDMMFSHVGGSGESGRVNITLLSDLPEGGITANDFGVPAYHFWIFNGSYSACLSYGGEFDQNPGWNNGAGEYYYNENFGDPNTAVLYPETDNYPLVPYSKNKTGTQYFSATTWKTYTWIVARDMMHLYWRDTGAPAEENEEIIFMAIPQNSSLDFINEAHGTFGSQLPPAYQWYDNINGLRFWGRGASGHAAYFSNIKITKTGAPMGTYAEFQNRPASQRRPRADAGTYQLPVLLYNGISGGTTSVTVKLAKGDAGHIDGFTEETIVFENTSTDLESKALNLTLTDLFLSEPDTLLFEIAEVVGGDYPTFGPMRYFELIIRPSGATSSQDITLDKDFWVVSPNPVISTLYLMNKPANHTARVEILDITGRTLFSNHYSDQVSFDVSWLQSGVYLLRLNGSEGTFIRKFIKE